MFLNNTTFANIVVWVWGCGCENWILKSRLQQIKWLFIITVPTIILSIEWQITRNFRTSGECFDLRFRKSLLQLLIKESPKFAWSSEFNLQRKFSISRRFRKLLLRS
uniref:Uncharacterized protein n=1 Tax=Cucumis sativus TaxID=3659 RepID=A0A0A0KU35_CUCSA